MQNNLTAAMAQAAANRNAPPMQLMQNGSVETAVNFAAESFYKAALVIKRATEGHTKAYADLLPGVQSFVTQQIMRINMSSTILDALGYQGVSEVLGALHPDTISFINATMEGWNKLIETEGAVKSIHESIGGAHGVN